MNDLNNNELLSALQKSQKKILRELDKVCKENELRYCLAFGSCLGAVRHKGFIPWDDDVDVYMPIADFEKLRQLQNALSDGFFLQTHESDPEYGLTIGRLRDSNTTLIEKNEADRDINHGIFVDIYPLYYVPDKTFMFKRLVFISMLCRLMMYERAPRNRGNIMRLGSAVLLKIIPSDIRKKMKKSLREIIVRQKETNSLSSLYGNQSNIKYPKEWFFPAVNADFDDMRVPIPNNPDAYLSRTYGDYMKLPPVEKQTVHHDFLVIDFHQSYTNYKGIYYCVAKE